ncbi:MAG TPA: response regulator [bacterium]|nr:response regulator [bacterium]
MALKLLLADDSITIRKVVTKVFTGDHYELATVETHEDFFGVAKKLQPDVVIVSADLPGLDLTSDLKKIADLSSPNPTLILMGQRGNGLNIEESQKLGAQGFVYKPLDNRELVRTIELLRQQPTVKSTPAKAPSRKSAELAPGTPASVIAPMIPDTAGETMDQRAEILLDLFESYFSENMVIITDTLTKAMAPRIAGDIASQIIEKLGITELPKQIMSMTKGIVNDLVPQIAERVISREIENIKAEAIRLLEAEADDEDENV